MKLLITTFFLAIVSFTSVHSQDLLDDLLRNDDITWVAETEIYFILETEKPKKKYPSEFQKSGIQTRLEVIKISPDVFVKEGLSQVDGYNALTGLIFKSIIDDKILAKNSLGQKVQASEMMTYFSDIDTFIGLDPVTYQEVIQIAYNDDS